MKSLEFDKYSVEKHVRIYDDKNGSYVEMRPDSDGLELVQINSITSDGRVEREMTLTKESAVLLAMEILIEHLTDRTQYIEFIKRLYRKLGGVKSDE